jgi:formate dehydrogenase major subunit
VEINRRDFLKLSGATAGGVALFGILPKDKALAAMPKAIPLHKRIGETYTICPYDASGCGFIVAADGENVTNLEGDPDHPINRGAACAKGASLAQLRTVNGKLNPRRLTKPKYRAPGATDWEEVEWDWALDQIAANIKETRDATFVETDADGYTVNRCDGIASVGGAALDNEECYLLAKMTRTLGMAYIEHQARI